MQRQSKNILVTILLVCLALAVRGDKVYLMTDRVTGETITVPSEDLQLPRCFICGLPVKDGGTQLPDGRWLCARDAKTAVLDAGAAQQIFGQVRDDLDYMYSRFTSFPTNIDVSIIDQVDVDTAVGGMWENGDVLGYTQPLANDGIKRYKIALLTGQSQAQLEEVCAHEMSHAWVGENVSPERHARIARDSEEGFCEMMGYLYVDSKGEDGEKRRVLANAYTRGQVKLFVAAEQQYGFDAILEWMEYGVSGRLEDGHLDEITDVQIPTSGTPANLPPPNLRSSLPPAAPSTLQLQGIMWGSAPSAIINGKSFFAGDEYKVRIGQSTETIRCVSISKNAVQILNIDSGEEQTLALPAH